MNLQFPILDGIAPTFADIEVKCMLSKGPIFDMWDIKALNTGGAVDIGEQKSGGRVMYRGAGDVSHTSSLTLYRTGWQKFLRFAATTAPRRLDEALLTLVHFDLLVQHTPPGSFEIYEFHVMGARVAGFDFATAEGPDVEAMEVPLNVNKVVHVIDGMKVVLG